MWVLRPENGAVQGKFEAAREHLNGYLLEPYRRQPHITLSVCGFLVSESHYNDDFTHNQIQSQMQVLEAADIPSFEIDVGGLNSFASAPFLEVHDPSNGIARVREILSRGAREFRTAPYTPHLTVGLYADAFSSEVVMGRIAAFEKNPVRVKVEQVTLATYQAQEVMGALRYRHDVTLTNGSKKT